MKTHVSYNGYLQKIQQVYNFYDAPKGMEFVARGRLVNPKGSYVDAPYVNLYRGQDHNWKPFYVAVQ
jgi:hypothetical protein